MKLGDFKRLGDSSEALDEIWFSLDKPCEPKECQQGFSFNQETCQCDCNDCSHLNTDWSPCDEKTCKQERDVFTCVGNECKSQKEQKECEGDCKYECVTTPGELGNCTPNPQGGFKNLTECEASRDALNCGGFKRDAVGAGAMRGDMAALAGNPQYQCYWVESCDGPDCYASMQDCMIACGCELCGYYCPVEPGNGGDSSSSSCAADDIIYQILVETNQYQLCCPKDKPNVGQTISNAPIACSGLAVQENSLNYCFECMPGGGGGGPGGSSSSSGGVGGTSSSSSQQYYCVADRIVSQTSSSSLYPPYFHCITTSECQSIFGPNWISVAYLTDPPQCLCVEVYYQNSFMDDVLAQAFIPGSAPYCVDSSELNYAKHVVFSGPYNKAEECNAGCLLSSSSSSSHKSSSSSSSSSKSSSSSASGGGGSSSSSKSSSSSSKSSSSSSKSSSSSSLFKCPPSQSSRCDCGYRIDFDSNGCPKISCVACSSSSSKKSSSSSSEPGCPDAQIPDCSCGYDLLIGVDGCPTIICEACSSSSSSSEPSSSSNASNSSSSSYKAASSSSSYIGCPSIDPPACYCGYQLLLDSSGCPYITCSECPSSSSSSSPKTSSSSSSSYTPCPTIMPPKCGCGYEVEVDENGCPTIYCSPCPSSSSSSSSLEVVYLGSCCIDGSCYEFQDSNDFVGGDPAACTAAGSEFFHGVPCSSINCSYASSSSSSSVSSSSSSTSLASSSSSSGGCGAVIPPYCTCGYEVEIGIDGCPTIVCATCPSSSSTSSSSGAISSSSSGQVGCPAVDVPSCDCGYKIGISPDGCPTIECSPCLSSSSSSSSVSSSSSSVSSSSSSVSSSSSSVSSSSSSVSPAVVPPYCPCGYEIEVGIDGCPTIVCVTCSSSSSGSSASMSSSSSVGIGCPPVEVPSCECGYHIGYDPSGCPNIKCIGCPSSSSSSVSSSSSSVSSSSSSVSSSSSGGCPAVVPPYCPCGYDVALAPNGCPIIVCVGCASSTSSSSISSSSSSSGGIACPAIQVPYCGCGYSVGYTISGCPTVSCLPCPSSSSCSSSGSMVSSFCQDCDRWGVYSNGSCGTYTSELPVVLADPSCCPPYGTFLFESCDGCSSYRNFADGLGGIYQELKNEGDLSCCPPAGTFLNSFCTDCDRTNVLADGSGGTYDQVNPNDTTCPGCGPASYSVTVHKCDSTQSFPCYGDMYIIDCALENGVDLPYSGRTGTDLVAIGLLLSGQVDQPDQTILDDDQMASGLFSYDVAYPLSNVEFTICNVWGSSSSSSSVVAGNAPEPSSSSSAPLVFSITSQPSNKSISVGQGTASLFSVAAVSPSPITYKWQISNNFGLTYYDINSSGGVFYGVNSPTLGLNAGMADMSSTWNNARFRCVLVSNSTTLVSGYGVLTVS